jgi:hypothetical protein
LHSFYEGNGRAATITLLRAIRALLSSARTEPAAESNPVESCPDTHHGLSSDHVEHHGHHHISTLPVQCMTIATSYENPISTFQDRRICRRTTSRVKNSASNNQSCDVWSSNDLYMYCKPFMIVNSNSDCHINAKTTTNGLCHKKYVPEICAALLFNLALIHHIAGIRKNGSCGKSSLLKKALLCYNEALHHIRHCTTKVAVLVAAICNNRIHLYHHYFYDSIQGRKQLNMMDHALTYIEHTYIARKVECGRTKSGTPASRHEICIVLTDPRKVTQTISPQDLHRFRLTYAFTKMHDFRLSPAA